MYSQSYDYEVLMLPTSPCKYAESAFRPAPCRAVSTQIYRLIVLSNFSFSSGTTENIQPHLIAIDPGLGILLLSCTPCRLAPGTPSTCTADDRGLCQPCGLMMTYSGSSASGRKGHMRSPGNRLQNRIADGCVSNAMSCSERSCRGRRSCSWQGTICRLTREENEREDLSEHQYLWFMFLATTGEYTWAKPTVPGGYTAGCVGSQLQPRRRAYSHFVNKND